MLVNSNGIELCINQEFVIWRNIEYVNNNIIPVETNDIKGYSLLFLKKIIILYIKYNNPIVSPISPSDSCFEFANV